MKYTLSFLIALFASLTSFATLGPISGPGSVCGGSNITLTNATSGGTWSSSSTAIASITSSTGIVTGGSVTTTGTVTITYTVGAEAVYTVLTVNPTPVIMGSSVFCPGYITDTFTCSMPGGIWTCDSVAADSMAPTGRLYHVYAPWPYLMTDTVRYIMPTGCIGKQYVHVNPTMGVAGVSNICAGTPTALASLIWGNWNTSTPSIATISTATMPNMITGISEGTASLTFNAYKIPAPGTCPMTWYATNVWTGISTSYVTAPPATACLGPTVVTSVCGTTPTDSITTLWGDGLTDVSPVSIWGDLMIAHAYSMPGTYTIKQKLYDSGILLDSVTHTYTYNHCNTLPIMVYDDNNSNCIFDGTDIYSYFPCMMQIDSAGITIDTLSAVSGLYYKAWGPPGTVYAFRIISLSSSMTVACPSSGVIYDTISASVSTYPSKAFGLHCSTVSGHDLSLWRICSMWRAYDAQVKISVRNSTCSTVSPVVTMGFSPKYSFDYATPAPSSVVGNIITWNVAPAASNMTPPLTMVAHFITSGPMRIPGDTAISSYTVSPITGDIYTPNNNVTDTSVIIGPMDPNNITVSPSGLVPAGTILTYTVNFENTGNDTAHNIHVLDTISSTLDINTLEMLDASARMNIVYSNIGGQNIVKFDFPNIRLLDSSHHDQCDGGFRFRIKVKDGLADGTLIPHRVGIYFDVNDVVMTNNAEDTIGTPAGPPPPPLSVNDIATGAQIYPNPASNLLTIKTQAATSYSALTITNSIGQLLIQQSISQSTTTVDIKALPAGVYYITLRGDGYKTVRKFVKE